MIKPSIKLVKYIFDREKYELEAPFEYLNIVGWRNSNSRLNHYDDLISVYWRVLYEGWKELHMSATTLPGLPYLLKPINPKGTAILLPGHYKNAYTLGLHQGKYEALVQAGPVKVYRDNTKDAKIDKNPDRIDEGYFGINIHRASLGAKVVGADSAGCQVIYDRSVYSRFIDLCKVARSKGQLYFTYTLVEI